MHDPIERLARGEPDAFAQLYDDHADALYRYLATRLASRDAAADVLQEVFLRVVRAGRRLRRVENLRAYLFRIARNEASRWRSRRRLPIEPGVAPDEAVAAQNRAGRQPGGDADHAAALLARLNPNEREAVVLKLHGGLTFREIALTLDEPQATVATRYRRAIAKLRRQLAREPE